MLWWCEGSGAEKNTEMFLGKKIYKPACFLLQSKWVHFYFCFGKFLKAKLH